MGINTELSQANSQVKTTFDIKQKLKEQQVIAGAVGDMSEAVTTYSEQKQKAAQEEVKKAEKALTKAKAENASKEELSNLTHIYNQAKAEAESWQTGGSSKRKLDAAVMTLGTILSGGSAGEAAVSALSPELNAKIHEYTKDSRLANLLAHATLSALEAKASGNNAFAGAASGVAGEASAMLLSEMVFNKSASQLTEEERNLLSLAGQLSGALAGNVTGGNTASTLQGMRTAKSAVENNYFSNIDVENLIRELDKAQKEGRDTKPIFEKYKGLSEKNRKELIACKGNVLCESAHLYQMNTGAQELENNLGFFSSMMVYYPNDLNSANRITLSNLVDKENAESFSKLSSATKLGLTAIEAGSAIGAVGGLAKDGFNKVKNLVSEKNKAYPASGMDKHQRKMVGDSDYPSGAENVALYPKLKEQLIKENLQNTVTKNPVLDHAAFGKGNLTVNGIFTRKETERLASEWVGDGAIRNSDGGLTSLDGTRRYRPANSKLNSPYAKTGIQANFERGYTNEKGKFISESNLHINIKD
ncbi:MULTISPECIES: VENN motif pre-toxin domain-containing protein [Rodentibacter]|uniref:VENN motif pre-toxin domain-containing protein n=1 Tax=Rodentibacter TaxID=1960084 RepID=UPI001CFCEA73|nr:VENN motif pre-toxin domain-containing protein [Rodentibacter sp. JRC1]GJI55694.1 hypothetical protein HEMROJRC1_08060 [Rodentibacter sp. JRC1]